MNVAPAPACRLDVERAAVGLGDRTGDVEPQARAGLREAVVAHPAELLEDDLLGLGRDAGPVVAHAHGDDAVLAGGGDLDLVAVDRVLDRVRQQVPEQLAQPLAVSLHGGKRGRDARRHAHLVLAERDDGGRLPDELLDVHRVEGVRERPRLDARGVENVADEVGEPGGLALDQAEERLALLRRQLAPTAVEGLGAADHRGHRRAQLVRDHGHEVGPERREPAQLGDGAALGLVGPDVLDGGGDLAGEEHHHLDLLGRELRPAVARDRQRAERPVRQRERCHDLLGSLPCDPAAGGEDRVGLSGQVDLEAVERDHARELVAERCERLPLLERGAERAGRAVDGLEHVGAVPEPVAQVLGLGGPRLRQRRLGAEAVDQPADHQADEDLQAERERDVVEVERRRPELLGAPPLGEEDERQHDDGDDGPALLPVAERALDHGEVEDPPGRRARLERVDEDERVDDRRVEREREEADPAERLAVERAAREPEERDRSERERRRGRPAPALVAGRVVVADDRHLERRERHREEADPGDPDLRPPEALQLPVHRSSSSRASAHPACSRSSWSSPSAYGRTASTRLLSAELPAATRAFRRR